MSGLPKTKKNLYFDSLAEKKPSKTFQYEQKLIRKKKI